MPVINIVIFALAVASVVGFLCAAVVLGVRQKAIDKFGSVRDALDQFKQAFEPGDLVRGPNRFHLGRAQMILQTAECHYSQASKELLEGRHFWKALNRYWVAEMHLESARNEVAQAAADAK